MSSEGKLARAMAKVARSVPAAEAAEAKRATSATEGRNRENRADAVAPNAGGPLPAPSFRRVTGRQGEMAPSIVMAHDPESEIASQVRGIRGRILAMDKGKPPAVLIISSGNRGEGKTTTALNLSLALSEIGGGRVLLIDGDLLCPNVALRAGLDAKRGLLDVLEGELDLDDAVYETRMPNLDILPTRALATSSHSESALHQKTPTLLKRLREHYRFIIVDTPPVSAGSYAAAFGKCADGVLLVAQLERTSRHVVKRAQEDLTKAGARVIGCILTHQRHHVPGVIYRFFGASHSRYYRYGYRLRDGASHREQDVGVAPAKEED